MVSEQVRHKPSCTSTEDGYRLEILDFIRKERNCTNRVAETKALISLAVTVKLICAFVLAYAKCWFSHEEDHFFVSSSYNFKLLVLIRIVSPL